MMLPPATTIRKGSLALLLLLALVVASSDARILPARSKQVKVYSYVLPAGAEEIRDDINHSFACANRSDGFYVDIDNDCQIFHRCQDRARFSFICAERTVFSQMYQTCVHDGQLGYPCEDSAQYYPEGEDYEPSAAGAEPAEELAPVEEPAVAEAAAPSEEQAAPSKSSELTMVAPPEEPTSDPEMEASQDQARPQPSEETVEKVGESMDEEEEEQTQDASSHQQVNADLFDSVEEEEGDAPSENSAQEVLDETEPAVLSSAAPTQETASSDATSEEDTQEVEIMDDPAPQEEQMVQVFVPVETSPASDASSDAAQENEAPQADLPLEPESEVQGTAPVVIPADDLSTQSVPEEPEEPAYTGDSLLSAVQTVEELEPIVHDIVVEHADPNEPRPQVGETPMQDASPPAKEEVAEDTNEVLPELDSAPADMEAAPLAQVSSDGEEGSPVAESAVESGERVNELPPVDAAPVLASASSAAAADESSDSETIVSSDASDTAAPEQLASGQPEPADVKLDGEEQGESRPATEQLFDAPTIPAESPAIVEEMAPLRPNDSGDLPELIVSTEFHLDSATQGPAIRRRKTFLFRADALRSRQ